MMKELGMKLALDNIADILKSHLDEYKIKITDAGLVNNILNSSMFWF